MNDHRRRLHSCIFGLLASALARVPDSSCHDIPAIAAWDLGGGDGFDESRQGRLTRAVLLAAANDNQTPGCDFR